MQVHSFVNHDLRVFGANGLNVLVGERGLSGAPLATMAGNLLGGAMPLNASTTYHAPPPLLQFFFLPTYIPQNCLPR